MKWLKASNTFLSSLQHFTFTANFYIFEIFHCIRILTFVKYVTPRQTISTDVKNLKGETVLFPWLVLKKSFALSMSVIYDARLNCKYIALLLFVKTDNPFLVTIFSGFRQDSMLSCRSFKLQLLKLAHYLDRNYSMAVSKHSKHWPISNSGCYIISFLVSSMYKIFITAFDLFSDCRGHTGSNLSIWWFKYVIFFVMIALKITFIAILHKLSYDSLCNPPVQNVFRAVLINANLLDKSRVKHSLFHVVLELLMDCRYSLVFVQVCFGSSVEF